MARNLDLIPRIRIDIEMTYTRLNMSVICQFMGNLSPKELAILKYITSYTRKNKCSPTQEEIQEAFSYKSRNSVQQFVKQLVAKGHIDAPLGSSQKRALSPIAASDSEIVKVHLEGQVAAGKLTEAINDREYLDVPRSMLKSGSDYFALKVKGDSMIEDHIVNGDTVIIRRQATANNGQIVVAQVGLEATLKRFFRRKNLVELVPANPNYETIKISNNEEFKILGVLESVIRKCS